MSVPAHIAAALAAALRTSADRCTRNYDMKVTHKCSRCHALELYDAYLAIVQLPQQPKETK